MEVKLTSSDATIPIGATIISQTMMRDDKGNVTLTRTYIDQNYRFIRVNVPVFASTRGTLVPEWKLKTGITANSAIQKAGGTYGGKVK